MRKTCSVILFSASALILAACGETVNIGENGVAQGITVQATGTADVVPDSVRLSMSLSVLAETNELALAQLATTAELVRTSLTDAQIDAADIATQTVMVYPEYTYTEAEGQKIVGYRATQVFDVLIRDAAAAGAVVDAVVAAGGANVSISSTYPIVDDATDGVVAAREDAVAKARAKAEAYAELLDVSLGEIVYLTEVTSPSNIAVVGKADAMAEDAGTVVDLGTQEISVTVEVRWKLNQ
nr:SIMPL domain-containing protein [Acidobacteriota bacterium]